MTKTGHTWATGAIVAINQIITGSTIKTAPTVTIVFVVFTNFPFKASGLLKKEFTNQVSVQQLIIFLAFDSVLK